MSQVIEQWHDLFSRGDFDALDALLAEDCCFHSPVVHTPQQGKKLTRLYLSGAAAVLLPGGFHYVNEIIGDKSACLEFVTEIDGIKINGVDLIHWNDQQQITEFKVMVRPLKAIHLLHEKMGEMLEQLQAQTGS